MWFLFLPLCDMVFILSLSVSWNILDDINHFSLWSTHTNNYCRCLKELEWLFLNGNQLTTLDEQLPQEGNKLALLHAGNNRLQKLPQDLTNFNLLESLFFQHNELQNLGGTMQRARKLKRLHLHNNNIQDVSMVVKSAETVYSWFI
jgi:Leucine-rich repeat (LRR) protein